MGVEEEVADAPAVASEVAPAIPVEEEGSTAAEGVEPEQEEQEPPVEKDHGPQVRFRSVC